MDVKTFDLTVQQGTDKSPLVEIVGRKLCRTPLITQLLGWEIQSETLTVQVEKTTGRLGDLFDDEHHLVDDTIVAEDLAEQLLPFFEELHAFGLANGYGLVPSEEIKYVRDGNTFTFKFDDFQDCFSFDPFEPLLSSTISYEWDVFAFMSDQWLETNHHRFARFHQGEAASTAPGRVTALQLAPNIEQRVQSLAMSSTKMVMENALAMRNGQSLPHTGQAINEKYTVELYQNLTKIPEANRIFQLFTKEDDPVHDRLLMFYLGSFYPALNNPGYPDNVEEVVQLMEIVKKLPVPFWV